MREGEPIAIASKQAIKQASESEVVEHSICSNCSNITATRVSVDASRAAYTGSLRLADTLPRSCIECGRRRSVGPKVLESQCRRVKSTRASGGFGRFAEGAAPGRSR